MELRSFKTRASQMRLSLLVPAALLLALLVPPPCAAQAGFGFTLAAPTVTTGTSPTDQVFTFNGTLTNTSSAPLYLNGDLLTVAPPLTGDDSAFVNTFVFPTDASGGLLDQPTLGAGQSLSLALFNITIPTGTSLGGYMGLFEIQGGATANDFGLIGSQSFRLNVAAGSPVNPAPAVPEVPGGPSLALGLLMTAGLVGMARRRKAGTAR